jgi:hypothetical protein
MNRWLAVAILSSVLGLSACATTPVSSSTARRVPPARLFAFQDTSPARSAPDTKAAYEPTTQTKTAARIQPARASRFRG